MKPKQNLITGTTGGDIPPKTKITQLKIPKHMLRRKSIVGEKILKKMLCLPAANTCLYSEYKQAKSKLDQQYKVPIGSKNWQSTSSQHLVTRHIVGF